MTRGRQASKKLITWIITSIVLVVSIISSFVYISYHRPSGNSGECILKLYSMIASTIIGSYVFALIITLIGFAYLSTDNQVWAITYSAYLVLPIAFFISAAVMIGKRDMIASAQISKYYGDISIFGSIVSEIERNLSCCGFDNSSISNSRCNTSIYTKYCQVAAKEGYNSTAIQWIVIANAILFVIQFIVIMVLTFFVKKSEVTEGFIPLNVLPRNPIR